MKNYKELSLCDKVNGYLDLNDGKLIAEFSTINAEEFAIPLNITHLFKSENNTGCYGAGWRTSLNKQLKLSQNDTELNTIYTFTDGMGDSYTFDEKYYVIEGGGKAFVNKNDVTIDINGNLTYNDKPVYKFQSCNGFTLIPEINDFKFYNLIEQRRDEQIEIENFIAQSEPTLLGCRIVNLNNGADYARLRSLSHSDYITLSSKINESELLRLATEDNFLQFRELYLDLQILNEQITTAHANGENYQELLTRKRMLQSKLQHVLVQIDAGEANLKNTFTNYFRKKAELEVIKKQNPVRFLKDESGVYGGFNENGDLVSMFDSYGNVIAIMYDKDNKITEVTDNRGNFLTFSYTGETLNSITDNRGRKVQFEYNSSKRITRIIYPDGKYCNIEYNTNGGILKVKTDNEEECTLAYNGTKLSSLTTKKSNKNVSTISIYYYNNTARLSFDRGVSESYEFNSDKKLIKYTTKDETNRERTQTYTYANNGKKVTIVSTDNASTAPPTVTKEYDEFDLLKSEKTNRRDVSYNMSEDTFVSYAYDLNNRLVLKQTKHWYEIDWHDDGETDQNTDIFIEKYSYDAYGNLTLTESYVEGEEKYSGINFEQRVYNDNGNMIKCIRWNSLDSSSKFYEEYERDDNGRLKYEKDETGAYSAMYEYADGTNLVNCVTFANGGKLAYGRNHIDNSLAAVSRSTADGEANVNEIEYENGLPVKLKCGNTSIEYAYDHKGRKTKVKVNGTTQVSYEYDDSVNHNEDEGYFDFGAVYEKLYTGSGDITKSVTKGGFGAYDEVPNLNIIKAVNGEKLEDTQYTREGLISYQIYYTEGNQRRDTRYSYDNYGHLTQVKTTGTSVSNVLSQENYLYDEYGDLYQKTYTGGGVTQTYVYSYIGGAKRELQFVRTNDFNFFNLKDVYGRNTGKQIYGNGKYIETERITYRKVGDHATNMPAAITFGADKQVKDSIKYKYDSCGNISEITENGHLVARYTYDSLNRLIREDNKQLNKTVIITYDTAGNIIERCQYDFTLYSGESLEAQSCTHYNYDYDGDKLISYNGAKCEYNNLGNPTTYRGKACTWQYGNRLTKCGDKIFAYDSLGRRTKKGAITFTYDSDGRLIKQSNGFEFFYDASGVAGFKYSGAIYFYRRDVQGNIVAILNKDGKAIIKYYYDAWGNSKTLYLTEVGAVDVYQETPVPIFNDDAELLLNIGKLNPFRYRGYYYDIDADLYYLQTRYYDPEVGRFISQDSVEYADPEAINGLNLYAYCGNNPVMNVDPTGHVLISFLIGLAIATVIGATVGALSYVASEVISYVGTGEWTWSWGMFAGSVLGGAIGGALSFAFPVLGIVGSAAITGGLSMAIGMGMENALGEAKYTFKDIFMCSVVAAGLSGVFAGITSMIKIPGFTGRGSISQVARQINTKLFNGSIRNVALSTVAKMFAYTATYSFFNSLSSGIIEIIQYQILLNKRALPAQFPMPN